ncbi:hypothetical protein FisN_21Hh014 [Fistulifera solaris]|uniref:Uncharacterized protein n=1 Tax=Fistulifera solaris TaxID=1519565 RepID=A0A1Z5KAL2_FISSO|nr:hypothetical protein FisN_21Hh014 [Fistulifera solaris]|eukprot:GAX23300.1 hypothetical protein FisN_21Hh014 [Fistulifera solaris]
MFSQCTFAAMGILSLTASFTYAWGGNSNSAQLSVYGNALERDWLYSSSSISLKLEGCTWGYVEDSGESGCLERGSEDGTTYWYQMANCRRAQAVFSLYASSSGSTSCNKNTFQETFVTKNGLLEFIYYMNQYDSNNALSDYAVNYHQGGNNNKDKNNNNNNYNNGGEFLPMCEHVNNGYVGLGCSGDGTFSLQYFSDEYCLRPTGQIYDNLKSLNYALKTYKGCHGIYSSGDSNNLAQILAYNADPCSSLDSDLCTDTTSMKTRRSSSGASSAARNAVGKFSMGSKTWITKTKYVGGGMFLLASFVMFTGILFTNRRRRRALMQRKYRQAKLRGESSRRSSSKRSKSKGRDISKSRRRSKSRGRTEAEGVFT